MTESQADRQLRESVDSVAETIETADGGRGELLDEIAPLDWTAEINSRGQVKGISVIVTVGGPHIEIELYNNRVRGYWGTTERTAHVDDCTASSTSCRSIRSRCRLDDRDATRGVLGVRLPAPRRDGRRSRGHRLPDGGPRGGVGVTAFCGLCGREFDGAELGDLVWCECSPGATTAVARRPERHRGVAR